jgi:hypothetical protein
MAANEQLHSFLDFLAGRSTDLPVGRLERLDRWLSIRGSMALMPEWARQLTDTRLPESLGRLWLEPSNRLRAKVVRWAYPMLPCKQIALERVAALSPARTTSSALRLAPALAPTEARAP